MRPFMALQEPYKPGGASRFQGSGTPHLSGVRPVLVGECAPTRIVLVGMAVKDRRLDDGDIHRGHRIDG